MSFTIWINAKDIRDDQWLEDDPFDNNTHWFNCTLANGTIAYDYDCFGWVGKAILWMGEKKLK